MKNWRTAKALYHFTEISRSKKEEYDMIMTGEEVGAWCKMKNEAYGYIPGCGGDKSYQCIAVFVDYIEENEPEEIPEEDLESAIAADAAEEIPEEIRAAGPVVVREFSTKTKKYRVLDVFGYEIPVEISKTGKPGKLEKDARRVFALLAAGAMECNGKKCRDCGYSCYTGTWPTGSNIAELLR